VKRKHKKEDELLADQNHTTNMQELGTMKFLQSSTVRANETVLLVLINHKHYVLTGQFFVVMDWLGVMA